MIVLAAGLAVSGWYLMRGFVGQGRVVGTVVGSDGVPIAGVRVVVEPERGTAVSDPDGEFVIRGLPPGTYWLSVEIPDRAGLRIQFVSSKLFSTDLGELVLPNQEP